MDLGRSLALLPSASSHNNLLKPFSMESKMVNCPESRKPLRRGSEGKNEYCRENERCNVMFVRHSSDLDMTEIACTGLCGTREKDC
jgi:hypothetical protein